MARTENNIYNYKELKELCILNAAFTLVRFTQLVVALKIRKKIFNI